MMDSLCFVREFCGNLAAAGDKSDLLRCWKKDLSYFTEFVARALVLLPGPMPNMCRIVGAAGGTGETPGESVAVAEGGWLARLLAGREAGFFSLPMEADDVLARYLVAGGGRTALGLLLGTDELAPVLLLVFWADSGEDRRREIQELARVYAQQSILALQRIRTNFPRSGAGTLVAGGEAEQMAYVISHDLKSPIRAIRNLAHWVQEDAAEEELSADVREYLGLLEAKTARLETMIDGTLRFSRVLRCLNRDQVKPVDLKQLVAGIVEEAVPPADFQVDTADLPWIITCCEPLQRVLEQLIQNAIWHHPRSDGRMRVAAVPREDRVEFEVSDDGAGIDADAYDAALTLFHTLDKGRHIAGAVGVGLPAAKRLVEYYGGSLSLSPTPGGGCTVRFTWPLLL